MKLFISVDMEGISGVTDWEDVDKGTRDYEYYRTLMTDDVNAAIEGALEAGVTEIVVNDSHDTMRNLIADRLHPKAELIRGFVKPLLMMEGIDESFDMAFFIGYHCMAGTERAVLNHTLSNKAVQRIRINGREIGEAGINAAIAGAFGVPVVLVTGDSQTASEVEREIAGVHTVAVKQGIGMFTARCLHPRASQQMIRDRAAEAVRNRHKVQPVQPLDRYKIEIEFKYTSSAHLVSFLPGMTLVEGKTIRFQAEDIRKAMPVLLAILLLGDVKELA
jgi:D-amino peptidase